MKGLSEASRSAAARDLGLASPSRTDLMVAPRPASILRRDVLVRNASSYLWFEALVRPGAVVLSTRRSEVPIGLTDPRAHNAAATAQGTTFLRWSRFPYFVSGVDGDSAAVFIGDLRYTRGTQESWAATRVVLR